MRNYLIIGASSGIGKGIAERLIEAGHNVYSASRTTPEINVTAHTDFDASNPSETTFDELPEELHGIVYGAGTINLKPFNRLKTEDFQKDFQINVLGAIYVLQQNIKRLRQADGASVVLFSTVAVQTGMSFHSSVAASKGAIEGLTRALAAEYSSYNIRVNAIAPSLTDTPLASALLSTPEKTESADKRHPLGRVGKVSDIANMATFLLSADNSWISGQIFGVDGGMGSLK